MSLLSAQQMTTHLQASADCNMQGYNQISGVQLVQQLPVINEKVSTILIFKKEKYPTFIIRNFSTFSSNRFHQL